MKNVTWDDAGIESYNVKLDMIEALRKGPTCSILEQKLQDRFRDVMEQQGHDVDSDSEDDGKKEGSGGERRSVVARLDLGLIDPGLIGMMEEV